MRRLHLRSLRRPGGFTLVELLVAVSLTAVLMWGILQLYAQATRFSATMFTEAELVAGGRAVLDRIAHELTSAATLDAGYLNIRNESNGFDVLQFVAPVGPDGELAHVCYEVRELDAQGSGMLYRCIKTPVEDNVPPADTSGFQASALGVRVRAIDIQYIDYNSSTGSPEEPTEAASKAWRDDNPNDGTIPRLPRAVLLEMHLADNKGTISIVLSCGAYLGGSGI